MSNRMAHRFFLRLLPILGVLGSAACRDVNEPASVASLTVGGHQVVATVGDTLRLTAEARSTSGKLLRQAKVVWSSEDTSVVVVRDTLTIAVAPGTTLLSATSGAARDTVRVTVEARLGFLAVYPAARLVAQGDTARLAPFGFPLPGGYGSVQGRYASSNASVATVTDSGVVRGIAPGSAIITVSSGGKSIQVPVSVAHPYSVTYLGTLGGRESRAYAINQGGQIVGTAQNAGGVWRAFLWENGQMRDLGTTGPPHSEAVAINDQGVVTGEARQDADPDCRFGVPYGIKAPSGCGLPWKWQNGMLTPLTIEKVWGAGRVVITDINSQGQISGYGPTGSESVTTQGFIWDQGKTTWIGLTGAGYNGAAAGRSLAEALNDAGVVAVSMVYPLGISGGTVRAYTWGAGQFSHRQPAGVTYSRATDVSARGQVVGSYYNAALFGRTGVFLSQGALTDTVNLLRDINYATTRAAVNGAGQVVGTVDTGAGRLVFTIREGLVGNLNGLIGQGEWRLERVLGINDRGQIVGYGRNSRAGVTGALLLTPQ
jgi:probable HAF family extracellular repeat protein